MKVLSNSPNLCYSTNKKRQTAPAFKGALTKGIEEKVAKGCAKLVKTEAVKKLVEHTNKHPKFADKLTSHLIVLGSTIMSAFYVGKTLKNKDMDESKRKTLAINQALVWGVSTVMAYAFDGWARAKFDKIFEKIEEGLPKKEIGHLKAGFSLARTIIIVDTVYRFIAPVIVTPLANYIGNKLKKENK